MKRDVVQLATVIALASIPGWGSFHAQELGTSAAQTSVEAWLSLIDTVKSATSMRTLPGHRTERYVVFQFSTSLEHKAAASETVTAVREPDATWHVGGYFIK